MWYYYYIIELLLLHYIILLLLLHYNNNNNMYDDNNYANNWDKIGLSFNSNKQLSYVKLSTRLDMFLRIMFAASTILSVLDTDFKLLACIVLYNCQDKAIVIIINVIVFIIIIIIIYYYY